LFIHGFKVFETNPSVLLEIKREFGLYLFSLKDYKLALEYLNLFEEYTQEKIVCYQKTIDYQGIIELQ
jgi:hypothetical protein